MRGSRRGFVTGAALGGLVGVVNSADAAENTPQVERRVLGRTGASVSILGLGLGSAFYNPFEGDPEAAHQFLNRALDLGINLWDTAFVDKFSEELVTPVLQKRRNEVFLISKSQQTGYDAFMYEVERSHQIFKTKPIDCFMLMNLNPGKGDVDVKSREGAFKAAKEAKKKGYIKHIGVSGHADPQILIDVIKKYDPDVLLTTLPANRPENGRYEDELLPLAVERKMGVIAMKVLRHARNSDLPSGELIRYSLSLPGVSSAVIGMGEPDQLESNAKIAADFTAMNGGERAKLSQLVAQNLPVGLPQPWDLPGYEGNLIA